MMKISVLLLVTFTLLLAGCTKGEEREAIKDAVVIAEDAVEGDFQKAAIDAVEDAAIITEDLIKDNSGAIVAKIDHV
jgi:hypothetical protein